MRGGRATGAGPNRRHARPLDRLPSIARALGGDRGRRGADARAQNDRRHRRTLSASPGRVSLLGNRPRELRLERRERPHGRRARPACGPNARRRAHRARRGGLQSCGRTGAGAARQRPSCRLRPHRRRRRARLARAPRRRACRAGAPVSAERPHGSVAVIACPIATSPPSFTPATDRSRWCRCRQKRRRRTARASSG